jgi:predicted enzyme related to lactoylglutathione lyase
MTSDTKSAANFYTKLVGWKTKVFDQNPAYTMFTAKGRPVAGLMARPEPSSPLIWLAYIGTPNVDETTRQAESLGGRVVKKPEDIPTVGRFAILQDPQGAMFVAFTPAMQGAPPPDAPAGANDFPWHELTTTDWRSALTFYKSLFGWEETESMDMGPEMGTYQMYGWKGHTLGGMMNKPRQSPGPPAWLSYIKVADAKKAAATVKKLGGQIINGPMEVPGGSWIAAGLDPQGVVFALNSPKPSPTKSKPRKAKPARRAAARKAARKKTPARKTKRLGKKKPAAKKKRRAGAKK